MKDYSAMSDFDIQQEVLQKTWGKHPVRLLGKMMLDIMLSDYDPCNNPADAWPIIVENGINIINGKNHPDQPATANWRDYVDTLIQASDQNPLRAAMIVYLQMMEKKA